MRAWWFALGWISDFIHYANTSHVGKRLVRNTYREGQTFPTSPVQVNFALCFSRHFLTSSFLNTNFLTTLFSRNVDLRSTAKNEETTESEKWIYRHWFSHSARWTRILELDPNLETEISGSTPPSLRWLILSMLFFLLTIGTRIQTSRDQNRRNRAYHQWRTPHQISSISLFDQCCSLQIPRSHHAVAGRAPRSN